MSLGDISSRFLSYEVRKIGTKADIGIWQRYIVLLEVNVVNVKCFVMILKEETYTLTRDFNDSNNLIFHLSNFSNFLLASTLIYFGLCFHP
jgi:hypothetical protein